MYSYVISLQTNSHEQNRLNALSGENLRAGSLGDDRISGNDSADIIIGLSGSYTISGGGGVMTRFKGTKIQTSYTAMMVMIHFKVEWAAIRYLIDASLLHDQY
ncbi:MAG: hypothetical protein WBX01_15010 [Nitrososphaeraceae archaeon]